MSPQLINTLTLIGSILSIISFFPIMGAFIIWLKNQTFKRIKLKDSEGKEFEIKVRRKYLNNRDLTPMIQAKYHGENNIAKNVRLSILEQTLNYENNIIHIGPSDAESIKID